MNLKCSVILALVLFVVVDSKAQIGASPHLGFAAVALQNLGSLTYLGNSSLPVCTPGNYECHTPESLRYIFTGSGNWNVPENWSNNIIPPSTLPADFEIVIDPSGNLECILNIAQTISTGAAITIQPDKKLRVVGEVLVQ